MLYQFKKWPIYCRVGMLAPAYSASGSVQLNTGDFCMNTENSMSSVTEKFSVFDWLKDYELLPKIPICEKKLSSVLPFCLMWNLFESTFCNKNASIKKIKNTATKLHSSNKLMKEDFDPYLNYFKERYLEPPLYDCHTNPTFKKLKFRDNDARKLVASVLKGEKTNCTLLLQALLIIVYRFRCNLFHGEKEVSTLHSQNENFYVANHLLAKVLDLQQFNSVTA